LQGVEDTRCNLALCRGPNLAQRSVAVQDMDVVGVGAEDSPAGHVIGDDQIEPLAPQFARPLIDDPSRLGGEADLDERRLRYPR